MKFLCMAIFLIALSCGGVKNNTDTNNTENANPKPAVVTVADKSIILELKNPNTIEDVKQLVKNSGLKWDKMAFQNDANAIALIKVPGDKVAIWTERLTKSSEFKSVTPHNKATLDALVKKAKTSFFTFRKSECFGDCPVYNVIIDAAGNVTYTGKKYVTETGVRKFKLSDKEFTKLKEKLESSSFSEYKKKYDDPNIMDLPSTYITHKDKQVQIRLWKNIPKDLINVHEYIEGLLLDKKYFE